MAVVAKDDQAGRHRIDREAESGEHDIAYGKASCELQSQEIDAGEDDQAEQDSPHRRIVANGALRNRYRF